MVSNGFRRIPLKIKDNVVGIITTTDLVRYIGEGSAFRKMILDEMDQVLSVPVGEIMRTGVVTVDVGRPLGEVVPMLKNSGVGAVLVMDNETAVGIFTERDLLSVLLKGAE
jgi:predicted transcriptional regulator